MGQAHILWIHEDAIRQADDDIESAIGSSVLKICLHPDLEDTPAGLCRKRSTSVLNHQNGINTACEVHSSEEQVLIWSGNCLRTMSDMTHEEVEGAKRLFDHLYEKRLQDA